MHSLKIGKLKGIHFKGISSNKKENKKNKPKKKIKKRFILLGIVLVIILAIIIKSFIMPKPLKVAECSSLSRGNIKTSISVTGNIKAKDSYDVYTKLNNSIKEVKVKEGDEVKKGDVLAILDSSELEKDLELAKEQAGTFENANKIKADAALNKYKNAKESDTEIKNAQESVNSALNNVHSKKKIYEQNKILYDAGAVSESTLDEKENDYNNAESELSKAENALSQAKSNFNNSITDAKSAYDSAINDADDKSKDISIEKQELEIEKCTITAPEDGTVVKVNAKVGNPAAGTLFTIEDLNHKEVTASIKEIDRPDIEVGQDVEIKTDATDDEVIPGKIISLDKSIQSGANMITSMQSQGGDNKNGASASTTSSGFMAKISIDEDNENILSGMSARLNIIINSKDDVLNASSDAIVDDDEGTCVYVAQKNEEGKYIVERIAVNIGIESDFYTEVSGDDLEEGMLIINDPSNVKPSDVIEVSKE
ncbi:efflux RND transporter periplasmic adaptor subunit [Clostridium sp. BJN0001]|uniref:efflux RND transporter periplasmic adaptor subunit n=1 Tax=Clostridium sp. BJN0001 TaxID=2930219 RepID=UPI001FD5C262|nr:efflux RND transporter periplasmic adaptor subunit [Clostridium sp. BJN0001]